MPEKSARKIFHRLASIEEALDVLGKYASFETNAERLKLAAAGGRILSESIFSSVDLPPFDRAEMDGYAVASDDVEGASDQTPVKLKIACSISAGDSKLNEIKKGECAEIATGAPMPRGADSVVMVEFTATLGQWVEIFRGITPGENVASSGSDVQVGEMVLRQGALLGIREVGTLAAVGMNEVSVVKRPKVGIISTGDELADAGCGLPFGKIYDVNSSALHIAIQEAGGHPEYLGRVSDDYSAMREAITGGIAKTDILIISGGTSAGMGDLLYRVLEEVCRPGILIHGLHVKPGKPTIIAFDEGKPIFGLPGYPVSALIIFDQIVRPYLERIGLRPPNQKKVIAGRLATRVNNAKGKRWFLPVHLSRMPLGYSAYPVISSSGAIGTLAKADGYIIISEEVEFLDAGQEVEVRMFEGAEATADLTIMGSHCPGLDMILELLFKDTGFRAKTANIGSLGGLNAVVKGEADIAGVHLLDEKSMRYNEAYVSEAGLPNDSLIKGYSRLQGIIVSKGNPKRIGGLKDLLKGEAIFVNRNRGSGTRVLTDHLFRQIASDEGRDFREVPKLIKGYRWEAKTHSAVAAAISQGRADAGVGVKSAALAYGLDFIPIGNEEYDFVINPRSLGNVAVDAFLKLLKSQKFKEKLESLPGYSISLQEPNP